MKKKIFRDLYRCNLIMREEWRHYWMGCGLYVENILTMRRHNRICLFMVVISGFICWSMETRGNKEEFPRSLMVGWFEGIWWSFISMTTVGYGDKVPKSVAARLFSIVWISNFSLISLTHYRYCPGLKICGISFQTKSLFPTTGILLL